MGTRPEAMLLVRGGPDEGRSIPLAPGVLTIGRELANDIVLDIRGVSRRHARILGDTSGYWITDLGSRNGTFVNDARLGAGPRRLRNLDRIKLGGAGALVHWVFMESQATMDMPAVSLEHP
jgi:pSer/pThr/pTyr-binding forkhead associated (FHA) protein